MIVIHSMDSDSYENIFQSRGYASSDDLAEFPAPGMKLFLTVSPRILQKPDQSQFVARILERFCDV
jgi:hypothetical protein